jgi:hypothetical protein
MSYRRSGFIPPIIALGFLVGLAAITVRPTGLLVVIGLLYFYLAGLALVAGLKRIELVDNGTLTMYGYRGGPITVRVSDVTAIRYETWQAYGSRSFDFCFLRIGNSSGQDIRVWRYGWNHRRSVFRQLSEWIETAGVPVDARTHQFLCNASR